VRLAASRALAGDFEPMHHPKSLYSAVAAPKIAPVRKEHDGNPYEIGLDKNPANFMPLSPIGFLLRSASVYPDRLAVAHGSIPGISG
jgi:hypothetical protein